MIGRRMRIQIRRVIRIRVSTAARGLLRTSAFHVISVLLENFSLTIRQRSDRLVNTLRETRLFSGTLALEFAQKTLQIGRPFLRRTQAEFHGF